MILNRDEIQRRTEQDELIIDYIDLDTQLQPNGFDLTIEEIFIFKKPIRNFISFDEKVITKSTPLFANTKSKNGKYLLNKGVQKYKNNETIKLPKDLCSVSTQRSSFMRMGNICNVGFWDSGYHGSGYSIMQINNPLMIMKNARVIQMYFMEMNPLISKLYNGSYQMENVK